MDRAAQMARKLAWMPMDLRFKEKIVLCNILPAALYGAEAAHVNQAALHRLRTAIAKAIGPAARLILFLSPSLLFGMAWCWR